ncbi:MAG: DUF1614 domain-containing protein [Candidatus Omnitrophica bacterium]|nr:DUF1614 domain-containing protein [Candidatus Omnitrophota bacterium]
MFFLPISLFLVIFILILIPVLLILVPVRVISAAFGRLGIPAPVALFIFLASLVGSLINIPIVKSSIPAKPFVVQPGFDIFRPFFYQPPPSDRMTLAVNVGGAIIPVIICLLLLPRTPFFPVIIGVVISTITCYFLAKPVPGIGITIPTLIPPAVAILCAFIFSPKRRAPVAYISGVLGVLIGADILHLWNLPSGGGLMSIGGAGVFDGIFLVGILAALFA